MKRIFETPFGRILLEEKNGMLLRCVWTTDKPYREISDILDDAEQQLEEYFTGKRREFSLPLEISGTEFQRRVWTQLSMIPYGETRTYGQIAANVGCPNGQRAVAQACSRNKFVILIPCHRVVATNYLGGYTAPGGSELKKKLLSIEKDH